MTAADQALSSLTNFGILFVAGRASGPRELGIVSLCLAVGYGSVALVRAISGEALLVFGKTDREVHGAFTWCVMVGGAIAFVVLMVAMFIPNEELRVALAILSAVMIPLLIQDTCRYIFFSSRAPRGAVVADLIWLIVEAAVVGVQVITGSVSGGSLVAAWGTGALAGGVYGWRAIRPRLSLPSSKDWQQKTRSLTGWNVAQVVTGQVGLQLTLIAVGAVAGLAAVGGLRAVQLLLAPLLLILSLIPIIFLPDLRDADEAAFNGRIVRAFGVSVGLAAAYGLVMVVAGKFGLRFLFGPEFEGLSVLLVPIVLSALAQAIAIAPGIGNRALANGRGVFLSQLGATIVGLPTIATLAYYHGVSGAAWGLAVQSLAMAIASGATFTRFRAASGRTD